MQVWWFISVFVYIYRPSYAFFFNWWGDWEYPELEKYHYPGYFTTAMTTYINGTDWEIRATDLTPDWRVEEKIHVMYDEGRSCELERPMRNSPPVKQAYAGYWRYYYWRHAEQRLGCYCCTVYRRYVLLAGCAVITTKHVVTAATPTVLIIRSYGHLLNLENVVGGWYDTYAGGYNSSLYFTPARIHIHPDYKYDYEANVSHPIPVLYDISIWVATYTFNGWSLGTHNVIICDRGASGWFEYSSTMPRWGDVYTVAGYQFMKSYRRRPLPWFRYIVKTRQHVIPCPKVNGVNPLGSEMTISVPPGSILGPFNRFSKYLDDVNNSILQVQNWFTANNLSEWHWYHCVKGEYWGRFGFDSGGGMHATYQNYGWRRDGMAGMCSFSLKLRAMQTTHYFTVIDTWPVLDFMYDAFLGLIKCLYLDDRFEDSKWGSPLLYIGEYIYENYDYGFEYYYDTGHIPKYRR